jgi:UDP-N-acetylmuramoylalanine-D-glutamate ligase
MPTKWTDLPKKPQKPAGKHAKCARNKEAHSNYHGDMADFYNQQDRFYQARSKQLDAKAEAAHAKAMKQESQRAKALSSGKKSKRKK